MLHLGRFLVFALAAALVGCAFGYQARGRLSDIPGPLSGKAYPGNATGGGRFVLNDPVGGLSCDGVLTPADATTTPGSCLGESGSGEVRCSDGRRLDVRWQAITCRSFEGEGIDDKGNRLRFRVERLR